MHTLSSFFHGHYDVKVIEALTFSDKSHQSFLNFTWMLKIYYVFFPSTLRNFFFEFGSFVQNCETIFSETPHFSLDWVTRQLNQEAHKLATILFPFGNFRGDSQKSTVGLAY